MSIRLKNCLTLWLGSAIVLGAVCTTTSVLRAQDEKPKTPQEAAQLFGTLLTLDGRDQETADRSSRLRWRLVSRRDYQVLGYTGIDALVEQLRLKTKQLEFTSSTPRQEDGATVVDITPEPAKFNFPVVVVPEGNSYQVDLLTTFKKSFQLGEGDYQKRVFQLTDVVLPGLPDSGSATVHDRVCRRNLRELQLALLQYTQDYDEKFPPADKWTEVLRPYAPNKEIFNCPSAPGGQWGYAFNANLSGQLMEKVDEPNLTTAFYETNDLRPNALGTGQNLAHHHQASGNIPTHGFMIPMFGPAKQVTPSMKLEFGLKAKVPKMRH